MSLIHMKHNGIVTREVCPACKTKGEVHHGYDPEEPSKKRHLWKCSDGCSNNDEVFLVTYHCKHCKVNVDPFEARETKTIDIAIWQMFHFDTWVVQHEAAKAELCKKDQWIAYRPMKIIWEDDCDYIRFAIKVFDEDEILIDPSDNEEYSWLEFVPPRWASTGPFGN